jgi:carboxymethylenebutenolidase
VFTAMIDVPAADGTADAYLAHPGDGASHPAVLLCMDAFGLRPQLFSMAERLASNGYAVLVPNLFYRHGPAPVLENLPDLLKAENRPKLMEVLMPIVASFTAGAAERDLGAYLDFLAGEEFISPGPVALTGYCMGGAQAIRAAGLFPARVAAAASYHGGRLATDAPESPHRLADRITAELYFGHADNDQSMPAEAIALLEKALDSAGVRYTSELYAGATHGFTMADTAAYDPAAAERHWDTLLALLTRTFRPA